ncbi:HDOD domain-containing protein, partial [Phaeospirillum tilakii]
MTAWHASDEAERLKALQSLAVLDTAAEEQFDALVQAASIVCGVPISLAHGGPLRLIVPGYTGVNNIKYIKRLAFTAGLLHGTGDLIMKMAMPDRACLAPGFATDDQRVEAQLADLGYAYPEVGAAFAARWHFPDSLVQALRCQAEPQDCADPTYASLVHL